VTALAWLLIVLFPIGPWACVVITRAIRRSHDDAHALRVQRVRFAVSSAQALFVAGIAINYILGMPLPRGFGLAMLVLILALISAPPAIWLVDFYRPIDTSPPS
jgi:hypothetical protein